MKKHTKEILRICGQFPLFQVYLPTRSPSGKCNKKPDRTFVTNRIDCGYQGQLKPSIHCSVVDFSGQETEENMTSFRWMLMSSTRLHFSASWQSKLPKHIDWIRILIPKGSGCPRNCFTLDLHHLLGEPPTLQNSKIGSFLQGFGAKNLKKKWSHHLVMKTNHPKPNHTENQPTNRFTGWQCYPTLPPSSSPWSRWVWGDGGGCRRWSAGRFHWWTGSLGKKNPLNQ